MWRGANTETVRRDDELDLAARIRDGEAGAFEGLMRQNNQRLYRIVRGMVESDHEAEDIVQETYVRAFRAIASFKGGSALSTWLVRIAINETQDRERRKRPMAELDEVTNVLPMEPYRSMMNGSPGWHADPEASSAHVEIRRYLEGAIAALPAHLRAVFALRALDEFSTQEVADLLELKPETVKTRYHRAKTLLRKAVDEEIHAALHDAFPFGGDRCKRLVTAVMARLAAPTDT